MGHTGNGPHGSSNDEWRGTGEAGWRVEMLAKDEQIRSLTARLAEAEQAARWLYRQYLLRGPDSECVTERWPWLANSSKSSNSSGGE